MLNLFAYTARCIPTGVSVLHTQWEGWGEREGSWRGALVGETEGATDDAELVLDGGPHCLRSLSIQGEEFAGAHGIDSHVVAEERQPLHGVLQGIVHGAPVIAPGRRLQQRGSLVRPIRRYGPLQDCGAGLCGIAQLLQSALRWVAHRHNLAMVDPIEPVHQHHTITCQQLPTCSS